MQFNSTREQVAFLARRATWGLAPGELDELESLGVGRLELRVRPVGPEAETVEVIDDGTESGKFSPSLRVENRDGAEGVTNAHLHTQSMAHPAAADRIPLRPRHR